MPPDENAAADLLVIRPVTAEDWPAFAKLFSAPGAPKNCWCMAWRATNEERRQFTAAARTPKAERGGPRPDSVVRRDAIRGRVAAGIPVGLLATADGEPIGWCSIAPRPTYRTLGGPEDHADDPAAVWSIACFFVLRPWRGRGVVRRLIDAAVAHAGDSGARVIEAYPVAPDARSHRFMGLVPTFEAAGFTAIGTAGYRRTVMRRVP